MPYCGFRPLGAASRVAVAALAAVLLGVTTHAGAVLEPVAGLTNTAAVEQRAPDRNPQGRTDTRSWWERTEPGRGGPATSRFYRIRSDLPKDELRSIAQRLDTIYQEYQKRLGGMQQRTEEVLDVLVFATQADYLATLEERFGIDGRGSGGMFFVAPRGAALAFWTGNLPQQRIFHVAQHEGFHQFAHSRFGNDLPIWVNEGLAEFFGESIVVDGAVVIGQTSERTLAHLRKAIDENRHIPFRTMITMTPEQWNARVRGGDAALQYMQAWSMVHFLVYGDGGRYQGAFERYLHLLNRGANGYDAFTQAFGTDDLESFEQRWVAHAQTARPSAFTTAMERIQFLAEGARMLALQGKAPATLDELREALKAAKFETSIEIGSSHYGRTVVLSADDDLNFQLPDDDLAKGTPTIALEPAKIKRGGTHRDRDLQASKPMPATISTKSLAPRNLVVRWSRSKDGTDLRYDIDLK
jgi:hypothetical protein